MSDTKKQTLSEEVQELLYRYFDAASNLYGIIPLYKLLQIYNSQNEPISEEQFLEFVGNIEFSKKYYDIIGEDEAYDDVPPVKPLYRDLVAEYLYALGDLDEYCKVREEQVGKLYYVPTKEKLLKYESQTYFEKNLEFITLRAFLRNQSYLSKEQADGIAEDIQGIIVIDGWDISFAIENSIRLGLKLDNESTCEEFVCLCKDLANGTRMHIHCGHTYNELQGI